MILPLVCLVCFLSAYCRPTKETSDNVLSNSVGFFGKPRASSRALKLHMASWKFFCEEFVRRRLIASPLYNLIKPLLTPDGWQEEQCVY